MKSSSTRLYSSLFNFFILIFTWWNFLSLQRFDFSKTEFINFASWINFFSDKNWVVSAVALALTLFSLTGMLVHRWFVSAAVSFLFISFVFIGYSMHGVVYHQTHSLMIASVFLVFLNFKHELGEGRNFLIHRLIQTSILAIYASSGLWKIRVLAEAPNFEAFLKAPLHHFAHSVAEGNGPGFLLQDLLKSPHLEGLMLFGLSSVMLLQLFAIIPVFKPKCMKAYGVIAFAFHLCTGLMLGIWFTESVFAALLFLVIAEDLKGARSDNALECQALNN